MESRLLLAITVDTLSDVVDGNTSVGNYSLREAIGNAMPDEVITITATGTINLNATGHGADLVIDKALTINGPGAGLLTIKAYDPTPATKNGDGFRAITINDLSIGGAAPPLVQLSGVTITGGDLGNVQQQGGAIRSEGRLKLVGSTITGNSADSGGGIWVNVAGDGSTSRQVLTIDNCVIQNNAADQAGGLFVTSGDFNVQTSDTLSISRTRFQGNDAVGSGGGAGILADLQGATFTIGDSSFLDNVATVGSGGGVNATLNFGATLRIVDSAFKDVNQARGGAGLFAAVNDGNATTESSEFTGNIASGLGGGGVAVSVRNQSSVTIQDSKFTGNKDLSWDGGAVYAYIQEQASVTITGSEIVENEGRNGGGLKAAMDVAPFAITEAALTVERSLFKDNTARNQGGGIHASIGAGGKATITESRITGNKAGLDITSGFGAIPNSGGGVYAFLHTNGVSPNPIELTIAGSEISDNKAGEHGGGIALCTKQSPSSSTLPARLSLFNSTVSGNRAGNTTGGTGGGLHLAIDPNFDYQALDARLTNTTITQNIADEGGGVWSINPGPSRPNSRNDVRLVNSIASKNRKHNVPAEIPSNLFGSFNKQATRFNLIGQDNNPANIPNPVNSPTADHVSHQPMVLLNDASSGNIFTDNPRLAALADNGGPTWTHRPLAASGPDPVSPAIDKGSNALARIPFNTDPVTGKLTNDQRGRVFVRIYDIAGVGDSGTETTDFTVDIGAYEVQAPKVIEVIVSSSTANQTLHPPYAFSKATFKGDRVIGTGAQLRTVPVGGADTITVRFSEPVNLVEDDLDLQGLRGGNNPVVATGGFVRTTDRREGTWRYGNASPPNIYVFPADQYAVSVRQTLQSDFGDSLDGEWINPAKLYSEIPSPTNPNGTVFTSDALHRFPSGDGVDQPNNDKVENFVFLLTIMPDATLDNWVNTIDFSVLSSNYSLTGLFGFMQADFNGNADVETLDYSRLNASFNQNWRSLELILRDTDGDGDLDGDDGQTIIDNMVTSSGADAEDGDLDGDGDVDGADYLFWQKFVGLRWATV